MKNCKLGYDIQTFAGPEWRSSGEKGHTLDPQYGHQHHRVKCIGADIIRLTPPRAISPTGSGC